jgi:Fe-S cluster biosynthesis and repair protein YggX
MDPLDCARCERSGVEGLTTLPFPTDLGRRIQAEICADCWEEWKERQMLLINHYGLKLQEAQAREFLYANLRSFLFAEGEASAEIDTSRQGEVDWQAKS